MSDWATKISQSLLKILAFVKNDSQRKKNRVTAPECIFLQWANRSNSCIIDEMLQISIAGFLEIIRNVPLVSLEYFLHYFLASLNGEGTDHSTCHNLNWIALSKVPNRSNLINDCNPKYHQNFTFLLHIKKNKHAKPPPRCFLLKILEKTNRKHLKPPCTCCSYCIRKFIK